jgi:glycerate kinase
VHCDHAGLTRSARPDVFDRALLVTGSAGRSAPALAQHAFYFALALTFDVQGLLERQAAHEWRAPDGYENRLVLHGRTLLAAPDPLGASTRGLGQAMRAAARSGAREVVAGLGGSASTDGGVGALAGAGAILHRDGASNSAEGGASLLSIRGIDTSPLRGFPPVRVLVDVMSPLCGPDGAAWTFGPQKAPLRRSARCSTRDWRTWRRCSEATRRNRAAELPAGPATAWRKGRRCNRGPCPSCAWQVWSPHSRVRTWRSRGRGVDAQSGLGKLVSAVLAAAAAAGVPAQVIAGQVDADPGVPARSLTAIARSAEEAMRHSAQHVRTAARQLAEAIATAGRPSR